MKPGPEPLVFVVDDDLAMRKSLVFLIGGVGYTCLDFASADAFLAQYRAGCPGCLVVDVRMPGMSGLDLQQKLNALDSTLGVIFISGHGDIPMAVRAIRAGAVEFLEKPFNDQVLLDRIGEAIARSVETTRRKQHQSTLSSQLERLTPREKEVLDSIVSGKPNKIIARDLDISMKTVEVHRHNIMEKMGVRSAVDLMRLLNPDIGENL